MRPTDNDNACPCEQGERRRFIIETTMVFELDTVRMDPVTALQMERELADSAHHDMLPFLHSIAAEVEHFSASTRAMSQEVKR